MGSRLPATGTKRIVVSGEGALVDTGELRVDPSFENVLRLKVLPVEFALLAGADVDSSSKGLTVLVVAWCPSKVPRRMTFCTGQSRPRFSPLAELSTGVIDVLEVIDGLVGVDASNDSSNQDRPLNPSRRVIHVPVTTINVLICSSV